VIADANEKRRAGTAALYGITDQGDDALRGTVDIFFHEHVRATVGYGVAPEARGRGLATGAVRTLSGWAFEHAPQLVRLELLVMPGNVASTIVAERAGFVREGVLRSIYPYGNEHRDVIVYSLLLSDL
jgi:ribosomal-protein-alanine N-acetyltransferase